MSRGELLDLLVVARAARRPAAGPTDALESTEAYDELLALEDRVRAATARWLNAHARSEQRLGRIGRGAIGTLATALRSGRSARRAQLARLDHVLTHALPLWVGSLPDIEDLLPQVPGLFDLVVVDEASSVTQPLAAPALLRGRRGVVVGDPRQLRHISFLGDVELETVLTAHAITERPGLAAVLDVRRNSVFDVAASAADVITLNEHYRGLPHLVDFVSRRVYRHSFSIATRTPATESLDCIQLEQVKGKRDAHGVVRSEVDAVVAHLRRLLGESARSVGVIAPFRAQADALEQAVLAAFTADELEELDLRVGTVHAFQGNERDVVLVSLGIGPDEGPATWRFVNEPHLFAVLASRARRRLVMFLAAEPPARTLLADYLAQADRPPARPPAGDVDAWTRWIAQELASAGHAVATGYSVGRHVVDICVTDLARPTAIVTDVHRSGPDEHIARHLDLLGLGWRVHEVLPQRWRSRREQLAVELLAQLLDG